MIHVSEDIGRHNALDKLIGKVMLSSNLSVFETGILVLSGRVGFEMIQKSVSCGITTVVSVGAPSSLAIELAKQTNQILIGFANNVNYNIYAGNDSIIN